MARPPSHQVRGGRPLQLVAYVEDGPLRFPLLSESAVLGSGATADICLPYPGVAGLHLRVTSGGGGVAVEDLGSRAGIEVNGSRCRASRLEPLDELRVGSVVLLLEEIRSSRSAASDPDPGPPSLDSAGLIEALAGISRWVLADAESRTSLESLVREVLAAAGGGLLVLLVGDGDTASIRFVVATDGAWLDRSPGLWAGSVPGATGGGEVAMVDGEETWIFSRSFRAVGREYQLLVALPALRPSGRWLENGLGVLGELLVLGLVHHVGHYEPLVPGRAGSRDLVLDPSLVLGESKGMRRVAELVRAAAEPPVNVLLLGEPGTGRRLVARSIHLSGTRRGAPFVVATVTGAPAARVLADLFGGEVVGRDGPLRREGKLALADGGTLYLDGADELPPAAQGPLVRYLRTGELEVPGGVLARTDVRLVASSRGALDLAVARGTFRADLAYLLQALIIEVPPLRQRREDLPLILQSAVNRICHQLGTRVLGITPTALALLTAYAYPGNLTELDGIVRQIVALAPAGRPIDVAHLPAAVRTASVREASRVGPDSDLALGPLVASCEAAAIKSALARTRGNRSAAAVLLGISRSGLQLKMKRYGVE